MHGSLPDVKNGGPRRVALSVGAAHVGAIHLELLSARDLGDCWVAEVALQEKDCLLAEFSEGFVLLSGVFGAHWIIFLLRFKTK